MSNDLIALVVALALALFVVGLGLRRRRLGELTRRWLPQFESAQTHGPEGKRSYADERGRRRMSTRTWWLLVGMYSAWALYHAVAAVVADEERLFHASFAILLFIGVAVYVWKRRLWTQREPGSC
jgi:hypothetical protein